MSWAPVQSLRQQTVEYAKKVMTIVAGMIEERLNEENAKESRSHLAERA